MAVELEKLNDETFIDGVQTTLYAIVRVGRTSFMKFHPGVAEYFDSTYPQLFAFGTLNSVPITNPEWWKSNFRSSIGPLRTAGSDGYFLFEAGTVISHHAGLIRHSSVSYGGETNDPQARQRIQDAAFAGRSRINEVELEACIEIVSFFDEYIVRKQAEAGFSSDGYSTASDSFQNDAHTRQSVQRPRMRSPDEVDPYELLEVAEDVDLATLKAAFKKQMKLNHPDKVSHMSKAIQDFASAQVKAIKAAYDTVKGHHE